MAYDAWTEGYLKAKQSKANKFDPNISIRFERVGNWIVSAKVLGGYKNGNMHLPQKDLDGTL